MDSSNRAPSPGMSIESKRLQTMKRKFKKNSKGQMMVLFAGIIATLLGAIGLCTDVAVMYVNHLQLQKAADAAVVSGAGWLNGTDSTGDTKAITTAGNFAASNGISSSEIVGGAAAVSGDHKTITITLSRTVPYLFGRVIGLINAPIQVTATAGLEAVTGAGG